jgi:hypothetical protein
MYIFLKMEDRLKMQDCFRLWLQNRAGQVTEWTRMLRKSKPKEDQGPFHIDA